MQPSAAELEAVQALPEDERAAKLQKLQDEHKAKAKAKANSKPNASSPAAPAATGGAAASPRARAR